MNRIYYFIVSIILFFNIQSLKVDAENIFPFGDAICSDKYFDFSVFSFVYRQADEIPIFNNGIFDVIKYLNVNQPLVQMDKIQTSVRIKFIVEKDGKIVRCKIIGKKKRNYTIYEKEVIRLLKTMPKWKPARCNDKNVAFLYYLIYQIDLG